MKKKILHALSVGCVAGSCAGIIAGIFARITMHIVASAMGVHSQHTVLGNLILIGCFVIGGVVLGPIYVGICELSSGPPELQAGVFGLLIILILNVPVYLLQKFNGDCMPGNMAVICTIMFALILPIYGIAISLSSRLVEQYLFSYQVEHNKLKHL